MKLFYECRAWRFAACRLNDPRKRVEQHDALSVMVKLQDDTQESSDLSA